MHIFCNTSSDHLHSCSTIELDKELKQMALELQDTWLMSRIFGGDIIAIEAKYHLNCLVSFKNRYRSMQREHASENSSNTEERVLQARAFSDLILNIEDSIRNGTYLFKLKDLFNMFTNRLQALGITKTINKTRLKEDIMSNFLGHCTEETDGKNITLVFKEVLKEMLKDKLESRDFQSEALLASKLAKIIRKEIFQWEKTSFSGNFSPTCQSESVPPLLKYLISMIVNGQEVPLDESSVDS